MPDVLEPPPAVAAPTSAPPAPKLSATPVVKPAASQSPAPPPTPKKASERSADALKAFAEQPEVRTDGRTDALNKAKAATEQNSQTEQPADKPEKTVQTNGDETAGAEHKKEGKVWKILKETESRFAALQKEHDEFKSRIDPEKEKQTTERLKSFEKREKELIEELRFHNFEKYDEQFQKDYVKPYHDQWQRGVREVTQLPVTEMDGTVREGTAADLSELMGLSPTERLRVAKEKFGDEFARDAIEEAKKANELFERMNEAKQEARKTLGEKDSKRREEAQTWHKTVSEEVGKVWQESDKQSFDHPKYGKYFKPMEGDQDGNQRLAKGRTKAERAFTENPFNPKLSPSERATVVERQNLICNRAAAFGRLVKWNEEKDGKIADLEKELGQYKNGEPGAGDGKSNGVEIPMSPKQRAEQQMNKFVT